MTHDQDMRSEAVETKIMYSGQAIARPLFAFDELRFEPAPADAIVRDARSLDEPPTLAHIDFTSRSARQFLSAVTDADAALLRYRRVAIIQTWRALSGAPQNLPLAVTDGRSVSKGDLIVADTRSPQELGPVVDFAFYLGIHNPAHRWHYFRDMTPDELLIFQGYDFADPERLRVLHTAFLDGSCPPGAPPRRTALLRLF
ncbi:CmcJ/NvfI family oxidoreductase [Sphingobium sp. CAP-1]|uniref:CmcJ/NvfI family oxidoreductase n=1 Tax=Sphingobium sp. CAP-1 TaxID=2676077 RepID=UPI0012BB44BC|nr:CmcJ/NvfI family oxidoreductase [Sphingobium sp. CAP-1]QGP80484.1 hypothetical protein GL174_15230 [Sphingobium sp. CAP-1]